MPSTFSQRTVLATAIAACFPAGALAAGVARVDFASGNVAAIAPNGQSRNLAKGAEIEVGETISTQQGRAQLRFADGALMSLQPQTEFKVEEFKYSGKGGDASDNIVMNLLKGGMRTITGLIGRTNRNAYRLRTDVATIGIRGTEYTVKYTNSIEVFVADGAVQVDNQSGSFTVPGGSGVMVSNQQTPPQQTDQKPVLPPESPTQQKQEQEQQQTSNPVNPIQEAQQPVLLTGTITGNWAVSSGATGPTSNISAFGTIVPFTLDSAGALTSYTANSPAAMRTIGTGTPISAGNDGVIAWGRWVTGVTGGDAFPVNLSNPFEGPLHYVVGIAPSTIPASGTASYSMLGSSMSYSAGSASVLSSSLLVNFGSGRATFHGQFNVNGTAYGTSTTGATISQSGGHLAGSGSLTGGACGATINLNGFLAGDSASRAGMAFSFFPGGGSATGVIAYTRQ
jgi:hypothetical protein